MPEPQNDFIFSILCEELGFVGACAVILLFSLLLLRGVTLAAHAPDRFGALLVVGFVVQVALQAVLNIAVVTNTIPNTGISPVSYTHLAVLHQHIQNTGGEHAAHSPAFQYKSRFHNRSPSPPIGVQAPVFLPSILKNQQSTRAPKAKNYRTVLRSFGAFCPVSYTHLGPAVI